MFRLIVVDVKYYVINHNSLLYLTNSTDLPMSLLLCGREQFFYREHV